MTKTLSRTLGMRGMALILIVSGFSAMGGGGRGGGDGQDHQKDESKFL